MITRSAYVCSYLAAEKQKNRARSVNHTHSFHPPPRPSAEYSWSKKGNCSLGWTSSVLCVGRHKKKLCTNNVAKKDPSGSLKWCSENWVPQWNSGSLAPTTLQVHCLGEIFGQNHREFRSKRCSHHAFDWAVEEGWVLFWNMRWRQLSLEFCLKHCYTNQHIASHRRGSKFFWRQPRLACDSPSRVIRSYG